MGKHEFLFLAALLLLMGAGCSQRTLQSAGQDAQRDAATVQKTTAQAAQEAKPQLQKLGLGARVTAALQAANLHNVRVDADVNGVTLRGTVDTPADKARAGRIASDTLGPGKTVTNSLQVKGQ